MTSTAPVKDDRPTPQKTAFASMIGTMVEWYDYFIFGTASALVFSKIFFTSLDPATGILASFATFGVAFIARPIGAVVFGHFGDRLGRKKMLVLSLLMMGSGTVVVGVLPTYDQVGLLAPALLVLCRLLQGLAVGGEWGGAVLMAVEHAPKGKRAFYGSWPQIGNPMAMILATLTFLAVRQLPADDFLAWGWRIPFLASSVMIIIGLYIRLRVLESPAFAKMKEKGEEARVPIFEIVRHHWKPALIGMATTAAPNIPYYIATVFIISYAAKRTGMGGDLMLIGLCIASLVEVFGIPGSAILADRIGRKKVLIGGAVFVAAFAFPFFWLVDSGNPVLVVLALSLILGVGHATTYSTQATFFSELFPTQVRYTGTSVAYHFGGMITSGPVPLIATALVAWAGSSLPLSFYMIIGAGISILGLTLARESYKDDLSSTPGPSGETSAVLSSTHRN
ncbi:MFS transporter [Arthrobacter sp. AFG20]|uniref:MFS transporter n=1 Tax=Arthrobacter sp. AFG20 TaxID=1688671 RepID=UPI000C9E18F4|nr:MFS transporter [Arthrobacter sp. AFG20]PNH78920.1 MFS transporter [Arthrobacter sp. AFG20]